jgi:hypothetical protein
MAATNQGFQMLLNHSPTVSPGFMRLIDEREWGGFTREKGHCATRAASSW